MCVERLNIGAWTNGAQIDRDAACVHRKFLRGSHELSAESFALAMRIDAEEAKIHAVRSLLEINATHKSVAFFKNKKLAGTQILQRSFAVDAIAANKRTLDFKRGVDELCQRAGVGIFCNTNRKKFSSTNWLKKKSSGRGILPRRRVLPRCGEADCIWRCGRCGRRTRF